MKAVCHYCKDKKLAEQSNNLCVDCFNAIVTHYAQQNPAQNHYLETLLMGLKPEPLQKLYTKALTKPYLEYCENIIKKVQSLSDQINYLKINEIDAKRGVVLGLRTTFLIAKKWV